MMEHTVGSDVGIRLSVLVYLLSLIVVVLAFTFS